MCLLQFPSWRADAHGAHEPFPLLSFVCLVARIRNGGLQNVPSSGTCVSSTGTGQQQLLSLFTVWFLVEFLQSGLGGNTQVLPLALEFLYCSQIWVCPFLNFNKRKLLFFIAEECKASLLGGSRRISYQLSLNIKGKCWD